MSLLKNLARSVGVTPLAKRTLRKMGYAIQPLDQVGYENWLGLTRLRIKTILDIGACTGTYARDLAAPAFPNAKIHSFEPSPLAYPSLKAIADESGGRITAHNFGLGDKAENLPLHANVDFIYASSLLPQTDVNVEAFPQNARTADMNVEIRVLDDIAASLLPAIEDDLLVKIDVQGFEDRVIAGGHKTLSRARACIIEVQTSILYEGQPTFDDIYRAMHALGLHFVGIMDQYCGPAGDVFYYDAVFVRP